VTYDLAFHPKALRAWNKLEPKDQERFKKKLAERLEVPRVESARLHGDLSHMFKIKLSSSGLRLVYEVISTENTLFVLAVGHRDDLHVYRQARENSSD
jgi:mRNA interferase RelE/StbE